MTNIERAIREAVKGGYKESFEIDKIEMLPEYEPGNPDFKRTARCLLHHADMNIDYSISELLLDPLFWQALFKEYRMGRPFYIHGRMWPQWKTEMHIFIDHIADGKDAESFFEQMYRV